MSEKGVTLTKLPTMMMCSTVVDRGLEMIMVYHGAVFNYG